MPRARALAVAALVAIAACSDAANTPVAPVERIDAVAESHGDRSVLVYSPADAGPGSLRAAVTAANANPRIGEIKVRKHLPAVALLSPVIYTGPQSLSIEGAGVVIVGTAVVSATPETDAALVANGGGNLSLEDLTVRGSSGTGIIVDVPDARSGTFSVELENVTVQKSVHHGVLINDQVDYFVDPDTRADGGSPASVRVRIRHSRFLDNGFGALDNDGLRINEGGAGSLFADISFSRAEGNGADGIELDERSEGSAEFSVSFTNITGNGYFSSDDWDDGIDVDEAGPGDIVGKFFKTTANNNAEQGIDLNENNEGDLRIGMFSVTGNGNAEEGIELEEDDDFADFPAETWGGNLVAVLTDVTTSGNGANDGDAGLKLREKFTGDLTARVYKATALDNDIGGIQLREGEAGNIDAQIWFADAQRNAGIGIEVRDANDGSQTTRIEHSTASHNPAAGVRLRGKGTALLNRLTATANAGGDVVHDAAVVVTRTP